MSPFSRVAHGAGRDRAHAVDPVALVDLDVAGDRLADVLDRLGGELARGVDAAPEPGHGRLALDLAHAPVDDVGDQQPGRVRAHVDDGNSQGAAS